MKVYYIIEVINESNSRLASEPFVSYADAAKALDDRMAKNENYNGSITSRTL